MNVFMTFTSIPPSKTELLLHLALGCHEANPDIPDSKERMRKGLEAIVTELRKLDFVPKADIDDFEKLVEAKSGFDDLLVPCTLFATVLPDNVFYASLAECGMFDGMPERAPSGALQTPHHPKFEMAMARLKQLMDERSEAAMRLPEADALWADVWTYGPDSFKEAARQLAQESGLVPPVELVNDQGEPVFTAEQIAKQLGVPVEQVIADIEAKPDFEKLLYTGPVHKVH